MQLSELISPRFLIEGIHDPAIFKAIFVVGAPGSGKNTVIDIMNLPNLGFKLVDVDETRHRIHRLKQTLPSHQEGYNITSKRKSIYQNNFLGMVFPMVGRTPSWVLDMNAKLQALHYQTFMIYVDVNKDVAEQRVMQRHSRMQDYRTMDDPAFAEYFNKTYDKVRESMQIYRNEFAQNFALIANDENLSSLNRSYRDAAQKLRRFIASPIDPSAQKLAAGL